MKNFQAIPFLIQYFLSHFLYYFVKVARFCNWLKLIPKFDFQLEILAICDEFDFLKMGLIFVNSIYRKVASSRLSRLVAHPRIFRRLMKGKFDALAKKF